MLPYPVDVREFDNCFAAGRCFIGRNNNTILGNIFFNYKVWCCRWSLCRKNKSMSLSYGIECSPVVSTDDCPRQIEHIAYNRGKFPLKHFGDRNRPQETQ